MPLLAAPDAADRGTDLDALLAAGWDVKVAPDDVGMTVVLSRPVAFTAATAADALAQARAYAAV